MAYRRSYYGRSASTRTNYGKRKSKYTETEKLAYNLGRIQKGLQNPNSRVCESFHNGLNGKTTRNIKPLI